MANYNIKQIAYSGKGDCLTSFIGEADGVIHPTNFDLAANNKPGDWGSQDAPYQQILLNGGPNEGKFFIKNIPYYLELGIPKNDNFSMDFALLLIPEPQNGTDLDQLNYQFIRYLHVASGLEGDRDQSRVVLYQKRLPEDSPVEVAIAKLADATTIFEENSLYYRINDNNDVEYMWTDNNPPASLDGWSDNSQNYGYNDIILSHSWKTDSSTAEKANFQLIFTPRVDKMTRLYLYLIPTRDDNDIQWTPDSTDPWIPGPSSPMYYGRHINVKNMTAKLYEIKNLLGDDVTAKRIGVWGRSELMLSINGEEVKIGPSNYYELQNFSVTHLGIAAQSAADRFTVDIQY